MEKGCDLMPCVAEFGIIGCFDETKDYSEYTPDEYCCVSIDDELLDDWWNRLTVMNTYFHSYDRPEYALARFGVTLIPPESLEVLYDIVSEDRRIIDMDELQALLRMIRRAINERKFMIHYGV